MKTPEEVYEIFRGKYPDVFIRREAINRWCMKCDSYYKLSREVWKLLDICEGENKDA